MTKTNQIPPDPGFSADPFAERQKGVRGPIAEKIDRATTPDQAKAALHLRAEDVSTSTDNFGGILSSTDDSIQDALDTLDDIFGADVSITGDVTLTSTDSGSAADPNIILYRNSSSPASGDKIGRIQFDGEDDGDNRITYAEIQGIARDASVSGLQDGRIEWNVRVDNTLAKRMELWRGLVIGSPTGGDFGVGTINAKSFWNDGVEVKPTEVFRSSSGTSITTQASHTFAHGLSAEPDTVTVIIQCTSANLNYSTGDRVVLMQNTQGQGIGTTDHGISVELDTTNVTVRVAEAIVIADHNSSLPLSITTGSWEMYVNAFYFG